MCMKTYFMLYLSMGEMGFRPGLDIRIWIHIPVKILTLISLNPSVHGRFSRSIIPITHIENDIKRFLYIHIAYPKSKSVLRALGLKKAS